MESWTKRNGMIIARVDSLQVFHQTFSWKTDQNILLMWKHPIDMMKMSMAKLVFLLLRNPPKVFRFHHSPSTRNMKIVTFFVVKFSAKNKKLRKENRILNFESSGEVGKENWIWFQISYCSCKIIEEVFSNHAEILKIKLIQN